MIEEQGDGPKINLVHYNVFISTQSAYILGQDENQSENQGKPMNDQEAEH
jgi:hypothetical protein